MAVNLRWAAALACAVGVRGKHSTPPVYSSTSLGRRLAASPPVDGAVAHLRANPNPPNPTRTLTLALARALTLARWLTSERKTSQYNQTKGCLCPLVMSVSALLPSQVKRTIINNNNTQGGGALLERVVLLVRVRHLPRHGCLGLVGGCVRPLSVLGECSTTKGSLPGIPGITVYRAGFLSPAIARGKIGGI